MHDQVFELAYRQLRARYTNVEWFCLTPHQVTESIYREIQAIDLERTTAHALTMAVAAE